MVPAVSVSSTECLEFSHRFREGVSGRFLFVYFSNTDGVWNKGVGGREGMPGKEGRLAYSNFIPPRSAAPPTPASFIWILFVSFFFAGLVFFF